MKVGAGSELTEPENQLAELRHYARNATALRPVDVADIPEASAQLSLAQRIARYGSTICGIRLRRICCRTVRA